MPTLHARPRALPLLLLATVLLAGCGFHLRGAGDSATLLPEDWKAMALVSGNPNAELTRAVESRFEINGVVWTERPQANYTLRLGPERFSQRNLSLNAEARAAEFELTLSATFSVLDRSGEQVIAETTAAVFNQMENDPRNVVGKAEEVRLLRIEMRDALAQQIMRRVGFFAAARAAEAPDPT